MRLPGNFVTSHTSAHVLGPLEPGNAFVLYAIASE